MYFAECQMVTLGKICFAECRPGRHSAKKCELIFAECPLADTRQRILCRVSPIWHSAKLILKIKKSLPSARSRALGKEVKYTLRPGSFFFFLSSHSLCHAPPPAPFARRRLPVPPHAAGSPRRRLPAPALPARARRAPPARRAAASPRPPR